jgi:hypothetical protein
MGTRRRRALVVVAIAARVLSPGAPATAGAPALGADDAVELHIAGRRGVPVDAVAATLNVTVVDADADGYLTVYPCDAPRPNASSANFVPGPPVASLVLARLSVTGTVCLWSSAPVTTIVDVSGWFPAGSDYRAAVPARVLDSRFGTGVVQGKVVAGSAVHLSLLGRGGLPAAGVAVVVLNVTAADADAAGYVTVYPCDAARPDTSSVNYRPDAATPNRSIVAVAADGTVCLWVSATTNLIADVDGWLPTSTAYRAVGPNRVLDTRFGVGASRARVAAGTAVRLQLPKTSAAVLNVTAVDAAAPGFVTVYPCDTPRPDTSSLNFVAGRTIANLVLSGVAGDGTVCLYTSATTDLVADMSGFFLSSEPYEAIPPVRVLDGRRCNVALYTIGRDLYSVDHDTERTIHIGRLRSSETPAPGELTLRNIGALGPDCRVYTYEAAGGPDILVRYPAKRSVLELDDSLGLRLGPFHFYAGMQRDARAYFVSGPLTDGVHYVLQRVDTVTEQITATWALGTQQLFPVTAPDGSYALYEDTPFGITFVRRMDLRTGRLRTLVSLPPGEGLGSISPDGTMFITGGTLGGHTFLVVRDSSDGHELYRPIGNIVGWSPDGKLIVRDGTALYAMAPDGSRTFYQEIGAVDDFTAPFVPVAF